MNGAPPADTADGDIVVPLHSRRRERAQMVQKLQDVIPAAGLIGVAWQSLTAGAHGLDLALAGVELVTGAMLIATISRDARRLVLRPSQAEREPETATHRGVDWSKIWAAGVLFAEVAERWHNRHRVAGPALLTAIVTLGLGIFDSRFAARLERRRSLRITREHLYVGGNKFRTLTARWDQIASIEVSGLRATIRTHGGKRRRLNLADLEHAPAVRAALEQAQQRLSTHHAKALSS